MSSHYNLSTLWRYIAHIAVWDFAAPAKTTTDSYFHVSVSLVSKGTVDTMNKYIYSLTAICQSLMNKDRQRGANSQRSRSHKRSTTSKVSRTFCHHDNSEPLILWTQCNKTSGFGSGWRRSSRKVEIYFQNKFRRDISIHCWDITSLLQVSENKPPSYWNSISDFDSEHPSSSACHPLHRHIKFHSKRTTHGEIMT